MINKLAGLVLSSAVLVGGAIVLATTPSSPNPKTPVEEPRVTAATTKQPVLPFDKEVRTYLKSVASFMEVPPRDGVFGVSRVPTIHGKLQNAVPGYDQVKEIGKTYDFLSGAVGTNPDSDKTRSAVLNVPQKLRMAMMHRIAPSKDFVLYKTVRYGEILNEADKVSKLTPDSEGYTASTEEVNDTMLNIMARAVNAPDNSCSKCHQGVKKGETVGHVFAMYTKVKS